MNRSTKKHGLYRPQYEHDACGIGFIVDIKGRKSHATVEDALSILVRMNHRGASGADENTGDGSGILTQIPHTFFQKECKKLQFDLPEPRDYAVGMLFLPTDDAKRAFCEQVLERIIAEECQVLLGWRYVESNNETLGASAVK